MKEKVVLIDESYNASPASMNVCIDYFENLKIKQDQRKFIIIGEMLELGKSSQNYHRKICFKLVKSSIESVGSISIQVSFSKVILFIFFLT